MNAPTTALDEVAPRTADFHYETFFHSHYARIARVIARVVKDPVRAEELAIDVFWKLWRNPHVHGDQASSWIYRTAVRQALDSLRRSARRSRYEQLCRWFGAGPPTPEQIHQATQEQEQVRAVLATMAPRDAELLVLRSHGLSYGELAASLELNAGSVGTFVSRAQQAFRKEYVKQYGDQ